MRRIICDGCRTEAEPDTYGLSPKGWLSVTFREDHTTQDFCSKSCASETLKAREPHSTSCTCERCQRQEFIETGVVTVPFPREVEPSGVFMQEAPAVIDPLEVARMADEGNPNVHDEAVF